MKKYRINVTRCDGSEWRSSTYNRTVEGESEEDVRQRYSGLQDNMDEVFINYIVEVDEDGHPIADKRGEH